MPERSEPVKAKLLARIEQLEAALRPFADAWGGAIKNRHICIDNETGEVLLDTWTSYGRGSSVESEDFERAAEALKGRNN